jgi:hypothetical protein
MNFFSKGKNVTKDVKGLFFYIDCSLKIPMIPLSFDSDVRMAPLSFDSAVSMTPLSHGARAIQI